MADQTPNEYAWAMPSDKAKALLGTEITWNRAAGPRRKAVNLSGICIGVERVPGMRIHDRTTGKSWPAVRYLVRPHDGSSRKWTGEFPDETETSDG